MAAWPRAWTSSRAGIKDHGEVQSAETTHQTCRLWPVISENIKDNYEQPSQEQKDYDPRLNVKNF